MERERGGEREERERADDRPNDRSLRFRCLHLQAGDPETCVRVKVGQNSISTATAERPGDRVFGLAEIQCIKTFFFKL